MRSVIVWLLAVLMMVTGCGTHRTAVTERRDSVRVETRYERVLVRDTVRVEIPLQTAASLTADSVDTLRTEFAVSVARIGADGMLRHTLRTIPQTRQVEVMREEVRRDSVVYRDREVRVPVPVERKAGWREKLRYGAWGAAVMVLCVAAAWVFRKPLIALVRRVLPG